MNEDFDTVPQIDLFNVYLRETDEDRQRVGPALGYAEEEWEAWQAGWNAAKKYFGVKV